MNSCRTKRPATDASNLFAASMLLVILMIGLPWGAAAIAHRIVLRDGSIEQSEKVWESDKYVHFILQGTRDVEIRYAKEIVERIEYQTSEKIVTRTFSSLPENEREHGNDDLHPNHDSDQTRPVTASPEAAAASAQRPGDEIVNENRGVPFYDPRRAQHYWAGRQSRHTSLKNALAALARQYEREPGWVESHMGDQNDLGIIHSNLIRQIDKETGGPVVGKRSGAGTESGMDASDPGVAEQQDGPRAESSTEPKDRTIIEPPGELKGILFYDPRRPEKYWTGKMTRYQTLRDALGALAGQYHVSPEWVAEQMGNTNDLWKIHHNILKNLAHH